MESTAITDSLILFYTSLVLFFPELKKIEN